MKKTLLALGILTAFSASTAMASETITACVSNSKGNMRMVADSSKCTSRESAVSWNIVGEKGDQGEQGTQGVAGVKGDTGEQGLQGGQGAQGVAGVDGQQGVQGEQGEQGAQGEQGVAGSSLPSVYDGDGNLLGSLLGEIHGPQIGINSNNIPSGYTILSPEGYMFPLDTKLGVVHMGQYQLTSDNNGKGIRQTEVYYTSPECSGGPAYITGRIEGLSGHITSFPTKTVLHDVNSQSSSDVFYSGSALYAQGETEQLYKRVNGYCGTTYGNTTSNSTVWLLEAFPNDPEVTGVPNEPVALPIFYE